MSSWAGMPESILGRQRDFDPRATLDELSKICSEPESDDDGADRRAGSRQSAAPAGAPGEAHGDRGAGERKRDGEEQQWDSDDGESRVEDRPSRGPLGVAARRPDHEAEEHDRLGRLRLIGLRLGPDEVIDRHRDDRDGPNDDRDLRLPLPTPKPHSPFRGDHTQASPLRRSRVRFAPQTSALGGRSMAQLERYQAEWQRYVAELLGTFVLVFVGCSSVIGALQADAPVLLVAAFAFGIALLAGLYAFGEVSGGHFNPAVSLAMFLDKRLPVFDLVGYWAAQLVGGILAALVLLI